ncbi:MAG TPA: NrfD/PsrC family molybdoenzyme membrane anchor subunit [Solirubrobacteraceae bacterium]|jgi:formate-dependent nitrite reductase membrane component NrfD|nr:NrfD/PsrC family molybdoenzyme membrane anchor subunit [Solirubrobacteraceae bacterium]
MTLQDTTPTASRDGGSPATAPPTTQPGVPPKSNSYYGHPIIKEPTWTWEIPVYFVTGGVSGISSGLSFAARLSGNQVLARRAQMAAFAMIAVSPPLLISDLGRPARFYNMLRLLKLSSPMSVGSWILSATGGATALSTFGMLTGRLPKLSFASGGAAAVLGLPLSTYTAVLISNTSVPIWHEARHHMPFLFGSSSSAGAGALSTLIAPHSVSGPARRLAAIAAALELTTTELMDHHLGELGEPLHEGQNGKIAKAAKLLTGSGAALIATAGRRSAAAARVGGVLMLGGVMATRWSIYKAGFASAKDPKYTVEPQRRRRRA